MRKLAASTPRPVSARPPTLRVPLSLKHAPLFLKTRRQLLPLSLPPAPASAVGGSQVLAICLRRDSRLTYCTRRRETAFELLRVEVHVHTPSRVEGGVTERGGRAGGLQLQIVWGEGGGGRRGRGMKTRTAMSVW